MDSFSLCMLLFFAAQSLGQWEYFWSVLIFQAAVSMTNGSPRSIRLAESLTANLNEFLASRFTRSTLRKPSKQNF